MTRPSATKNHPTTVIPSEAEGSGLKSGDSSASRCSARNDKASGWTPERRARQAARICLWAPWAKSTGPKTSLGKAKSSRNAYKHGGRDHNRRLFSKALSAQSRYRRSVSAYMAARKENRANELLEMWGRHLVLQGRIVTRELKNALIALDFLERDDT